MNENKINLKEAFHKKDYFSCIQLLREEIKKQLIEKIQEKNPDYKYSSIIQLKEYALRYLSEEDQDIALKFYYLSYEEFSEKSELNELLNMYEKIA